MGRLDNNVEIVANPATKFIKWVNPTEKTMEKGVTTPGFYYWSKENETNVLVSFPFMFQYLQDAIGITGWLEKRKKNIFSNEVLDVYETPLDIKIFGDDGVEVLKSGFYYSKQNVPKSQMTEEEIKTLKNNVSKEGKNGTLQMIKDAVKGAKTCKTLYILVNGEIWRMSLSGSNLTAWKEFQKEQNGNKYRGDDKNTSKIITWFENAEKEGQDGKVYTYPVFKYLPATQEQNEENYKVYQEQIKPYFKFVLNSNQEPIEQDYQN